MRTLQDIQERYKMYEMYKMYKMYKMYEDEEVRDRWKISESVWLSMEPEAGRWLEIRLLGAGSVGEPVVAV